MIEPLRWVRLLSPDADPARGAIVLTGVNRPEERGRLLRLGFADVLPARPSLAELDARMERVGRRLDMVPAQRRAGGLVLDLVLREGFVEGRPVGLLPREFALAWRLAEPPMHPVTRVRLMQEVWRLNHVPETNSLAVHVCRLRAKLSRAGCEGLVETLPDGRYRLAPDPMRDCSAEWLPALPRPDRADGSVYKAMA